MEFIQHSLDWCRGEIFEGKMLVLYALCIAVASFIFWKIGTTPYSKSMVTPLLIVAALIGATGATLVLKNPKRMSEFQKDFEENPVEFVQSEKQRTDQFIAWYPKTLWIIVFIGIIAMISYGLTLKPLANGISLSILLLCFSFLVLDHFSKERAAKYSDEITAELSKR